jgi:hypothetical protein
MGHSEILELHERNQLPVFLCKMWLERTGYDPVEIARAIERSRKRSRGTNRIAMVALILSVVFIVIVVLSQRTSEPERFRALEMIFGGLVIACVGLAIVQSARIGNMGQPERNFPYGACDFPHHYSLFAEWSKCSLNSLGSLMPAKPYFILLAHNILVDSAARVLEIERKNKGVPGVHWEGNREELRREFEWRYDILKALGIAGGPYDSYFNKAREQISADTA